MVMVHADDVGLRRVTARAPVPPFLAAIVVSLLVAGCGTRLEDAQIEAAAGVGASAQVAGSNGDDLGASDSLAPVTGTDSGAVSGTDAATATGTGAGTGSIPVSPTPGGTGATPTGGAAATTNKAATGTARPSTAAGSSTAAGGGTSAPAAGGGAAAPSGGAAPSPAAPSAPAPGPATKPPIVIGHIGDYSGVIGTLMKGGNVMAQIIARYTNDRGGLDGHPIQVITADAGGDPARALSLARDMVENKGAVAFVGTLMAFSAYGPREYLEEKRIPVIGGDGTTGVWLDSPMYFTSSANFPGISLGALTGLVNLGKKKIAVFHCVEAEQCKTWHDTAVANASRVGAEIVYEAQVSLAQPDFTAECIQAQRNGADGVMTGVDGPSIVRFARACAQQGYKPQYMTASLAVIESIARDPNLEGLMAPQGAFPHMATDLPGEREYHAAMARYAPSLENSPALATVWSGGVLLREVAKTLPPGKVTSADFFPGLYSIKNNTLGGLVGPLTFDESGLVGEVRCVFFIRVVGAKWTAPDGSKQHCF